MSDTKLFPGFEHPASFIKRYAYIIGIFTMLLTDGTIINYEPPDPEAFKHWLAEHHIKDMDGGL